jgi:hypothetical protein
MIESFVIISIFLTLISTFYEISIKFKKYIINIFLFILVIFDGLRWETGTDWQSYYDVYKNLLNGFQPGFEIGFSTYSYILRSITDNYSFFLFVTTLIIYFGIYTPILKLTNYSFISLTFLTAHLPWYSGSLRQMMATVFFCNSLKYIHNRNLKKFILFIIIGSTFHSTIVPFVFTYWIFGSPFLIFLIFGLFIIFSSSLVSFFISFVDSVINILNPGKSIEDRVKSSSDLSNPYFGILRKLFTIFTSYILSRNFVSKIKIKENADSIKIKFYLYLSFFSFIFYIVGTFFIEHISSRLDVYTGIISFSIYLGLIDKNIKSKKYQLLLFIIVIIFCIINYTRLSYLDLFHPYKSIFYNTQYIRDLH